jgi:ribonuclease HI
MPRCQRHFLVQLRDAITYILKNVTHSATATSQSTFPICLTFPQTLTQAGNHGTRESNNDLDDGKPGGACCRQTRTVMPDLVAYVDGGSLGNPGPSGIGVIIDGSDSGEIRIAKWIGHQDNNVAEYVALLEALQCALALKARRLHVYSDSEVVVRQMKGEYRCRSPRLYSLNFICRKLAGSIKFSISHVRRENNAEANGLANAAVRNQTP